MATCPVCSKDMTYNDQYGQWYCQQCEAYPYHQTMPPYPYPPPPYPPPYPMVTSPGDKRESRTIIIVIVVVIILVVMGPIILAGILYMWVDDLAYEDDYLPYFPTLMVTMEDNGPALEDNLKIKHLQGDILDWSDYKMIITNNSDETEVAIMRELGILGIISAGETTNIDSSVSGFADINYEQGKSYQLEIYNLIENKRTFNRQYLICE